jgi:arylsulfatase A-like enzyme
MFSRATARWPPNNKKSNRKHEKIAAIIDVDCAVILFGHQPLRKRTRFWRGTPLLDNPQAKWNQPAYTVTKFGANVGKAVRTERWRYAEYDDGGAMLFDRRKDPHELKNLANDPAYAKTIAEMKKLLSQMPK